MKDIQDFVNGLEARKLILSKYRDNLDSFIREAEGLFDEVSGAIEELEDAQQSLTNARDIISQQV